MLPADFRWDETANPDLRGGTTWLCVDGKCVALVSQKITGEWYTTVNRHLAPSRWRGSICASPDQGRRWVERWATANAERLRAERSVIPSPPIGRAKKNGY